MPGLWVRKRILRVGRLAPGSSSDLDKFTMDERAQKLLSVGTTMYKERFENIFRLAQKLTSSLNIGEVLEMIRDEREPFSLNYKKFASS